MTTTIVIDEQEVRQLWEEYKFHEGDESYYYHLANYLIGEVREQLDLKDDLPSWRDEL